MYAADCAEHTVDRFLSSCTGVPESVAAEEVNAVNDAILAAISSTIDVAIQIEEGVASVLGQPADESLDLCLECSLRLAYRFRQQTDKSTPLLVPNSRKKLQCIVTQ